MVRRARWSAIAVLLTCGLVACSSTTAGNPTSTRNAGGASAAPAGATEFSQRLISAVRSISSAHVRVVTSLIGEPIVAEGDEALHAGTLTAYRISVTEPGQTPPLQLLYAGGKTYADPPPSMNETGKPWVLVTPTSSNTYVRTLARTLVPLQSSTSVASFGTFAAAATGLRVLGEQSIGGVPTTHYAFTVVVAALPDSFSAKQFLQQAGISSVPVEVWLDEQNRPVQVAQRAAVGGQPTATTVAISAYDEPVRISAPPAIQLSTD